MLIIKLIRSLPFWTLFPHCCGTDTWSCSQLESKQGGRHGGGLPRWRCMDGWRRERVQEAGSFLLLTQASRSKNSFIPSFWQAKIIFFLKLLQTGCFLSPQKTCHTVYKTLYGLSFSVHCVRRIRGRASSSSSSSSSYALSPKGSSPLPPPSWVWGVRNSPLRCKTIFQIAAKIYILYIFYKEL